jgi:ferrous iron transport protein B
LSVQKSLLHKNKIAIVGNPNVGKSALFNQITATYSLVSNFPYTTITVSRAAVAIGGVNFEVIDTPGIMSLDGQSEDGLITRDILIKEHPELVVLCMNANNIRTSLILASQIFEMNIPVIVCLNMVDESSQKGIRIHTQKLEELLGVPVIETVATEGRGIKKLVRTLQKASSTGQKAEYKSFIEKGLTSLKHCFPPENVPTTALLLLLLQKDPEIEKLVESNYGKDILDKVQAVTKKVQRERLKPVSKIILEEKDRWAKGILSKAVEINPVTASRIGERIGAMTRHPVLGWAILFLVIYCTFILVGKVGAGIIATYFDQKIFLPINSRIGEMIPWDLWRECAVGEYGILTTGLANAVGTVLPILTMFFLILNLLEDVGYIPNLCVLSNRLFKRVGLSGKAILPIILGFGCKTMATLSTKILESKRERFIAIFLIAFAIPCSSQLGINMAILALFPISAFFIVFGTLALIEIGAGLTLNKILKEDYYTDFILEIPPIRFPNIKNLLTKTYYRLKWFLMEAVPLFIIGAFLMFLMDTFYILDLIKTALSPLIVSFLNLPIETVDAFLLCLARHEAGAVILMDLVQAQKLDYIQAIVSILACFVPCFANIMAMFKEIGSKWTLLLVPLIVFLFILTAGIVNFILRWLV